MAAITVAYDNSTLHDFKTCMRFGYLRHIRGWSQEQKSPALIFGSAWHAAMDVVWGACTGGQTPNAEALLETAAAAFERAWVEEGGPAVIQVTHMKQWQPRLPSVGRLMLEAYIVARARALAGLDIVESEKPFAVSIAPDVWYVGKRDKLVRSRATGKHTVIDHKTTAWGSRKGFWDVWAQTWSPKSQIDGYLFSAGVEYPRMNASAWIDGALVHMADRFFDWIVVSRAKEHLDAWLWETRFWIKTVEQHKAALEDQTGPFMAAFPKNDSACVQFNRTCPYLDVCKMHANPAQKKDPPAGMVEQHWSPLTGAELEELTRGR